MKKVAAGRLALREEGEFWNAYYALSEKMDGALLLGSIRIRDVECNEARKKAFMTVMIGVVTDIIERATGLAPTWSEPEAAPENERRGKA